MFLCVVASKHAILDLDLDLCVWNCVWIWISVCGTCVHIEARPQDGAYTLKLGRQGARSSTVSSGRRQRKVSTCVERPLHTCISMLLVCSTPLILYLQIHPSKPTHLHPTPVCTPHCSTRLRHWARHRAQHSQTCCRWPPSSALCGRPTERDVAGMCVLCRVGFVSRGICVAWGLCCVGFVLREVCVTWVMLHCSVFLFILSICSVWLGLILCCVLWFGVAPGRIVSYGLV